MDVDFCTKLAIRHNEPIIDHNMTVSRLIGYAEDDRDGYLILTNKERGVFWLTAVGGYCFLDGLKGQNRMEDASGVASDDFSRLDQDLHNSGVLRTDSFLVDITCVKR